MQRWFKSFTLSYIKANEFLQKTEAKAGRWLSGLAHLRYPSPLFAGTWDEFLPPRHPCLLSISTSSFLNAAALEERGAVPAAGTKSLPRVGRVLRKGVLWWMGLSVFTLGAQKLWGSACFAVSMLGNLGVPPPQRCLPHLLLTQWQWLIGHFSGKLPFRTKEPQGPLL